MQNSDCARAKRARVTLEPSLQQHAALWSISKRLEMARVFERWAHQLRISVGVLRADRQPQPRPSVLRHLPRRKAALN